MAALFFEHIHAKIQEQEHACNWNATDDLIDDEVDVPHDDVASVEIQSVTDISTDIGLTVGLVGFGKLVSTLIRCHCIDGEQNQANDVVLVARDNFSSELYVSKRHGVFFLLAFDGDRLPNEDSVYDWARQWVTKLTSLTQRPSELKILSLCSVPQHRFPNLSAVEQLRFLQHCVAPSLLIVPSTAKRLQALEPGHIIEGAPAALLSRCRHSGLNSALVIAIHPTGCADIVHMRKMRTIFPLLRRLTTQKTYPSAKVQRSYEDYLNDNSLYLSGDLYQ